MDDHLEQFKAELRHRNPDLTNRVINRVAKEKDAEGRATLEGSNVADAVILAGKYLRDYLASRPIPPSKYETHWLRRQAGSAEDAKLRATERLAALTPAVEQLRRQLFEDNPAAPFSDLDEAEVWIRRYEVANPRSSLPLELLDAIDQLNINSPGVFVGWQLQYRNLDFYRSDGKPDRVTVTGPAEIVLQSVRRWASLTTFVECDLTRFVLCGTPPRLSGVQLWLKPISRSLPGDPDIRRREVTITLDTRDITLEQFRAVFTRMRTWLRLDRVRSVTATDRHILSAAAKIGPLDSFAGSQAEYFKQVYRKLPKKLRGTLGWQALRSRYRRLTERLGKR